MKKKLVFYGFLFFLVPSFISAIFMSASNIEINFSAIAIMKIFGWLWLGFGSAALIGLILNRIIERLLPEKYRYAGGGDIIDIKLLLIFTSAGIVLSQIK
jgi:hypothetical protein